MTETVGRNIDHDASHAQAHTNRRGVSKIQNEKKKNGNKTTLRDDRKLNAAPSSSAYTE